MGALFPRLKTWTDEILTNADLNDEIDNILENLGADGVSGWSASVPQMRLTTDPGEVGTESLASSLSGEIERLRFAIEELKGSDSPQWYSSPLVNFTTIRSILGSAVVAANRIESGTTTGNSGMLKVLTPNGANATLALEANPISLVYFINGTRYTVSADATLSSLSLAPASNNTCLVNESPINNEQQTQNLGEFDTQITVDAMGSSISALIGTWQAFSITNGAAQTEYFIAKVASATQLTDARRGYFWNSAGTGVKKITFADNDVITLLKLTWVFIDDLGGLGVTYNEPTISLDQPAAPAIGDYWFDVNAETWKIYSGTTFNSATVFLLGMCAQTSSACVAARTTDAFKGFNASNHVLLEVLSNTTVGVANKDASISVGANTLTKYNREDNWDLATDLDTGAAAASKRYHFYISDTGDHIISLMSPNDRRGDLQGYYHPHEYYRYVGSCVTDASSHFIANTLVACARSNEVWMDRNPEGNLRTITAASTCFQQDDVILCNATSAGFTVIPPNGATRKRPIKFRKIAGDFNAVAITGIGTLSTPGEEIEAWTDGSYSGVLTIVNFPKLLTTTADSFTVAGQIFTAQAGAATPGTATFRAATSNVATATSLAAQINAHAVTSVKVLATASGNLVAITPLTGIDPSSITLVYTDGNSDGGGSVSSATLIPTWYKRRYIPPTRFNFTPTTTIDADITSSASFFREGDRMILSFGATYTAAAVTAVFGITIPFSLQPDPSKLIGNSQSAASPNEGIQVTRGLFEYYDQSAASLYLGQPTISLPIPGSTYYISASVRNPATGATASASRFKSDAATGFPVNVATNDQIFLEVEFAVLGWEND